MEIGTLQLSFSPLLFNIMINHIFGNIGRGFGGLTENRKKGSIYDKTSPKGFRLYRGMGRRTGI